jgi:hypothetical protein
MIAITLKEPVTISPFSLIRSVTKKTQNISLLGNPIYSNYYQEHFCSCSTILPWKHNTPSRNPIDNNNDPKQHLESTMIKINLNQQLSTISPFKTTKRIPRTLVQIYVACL